MISRLSAAFLVMLPVLLFAQPEPPSSPTNDLDFPVIQQWWRTFDPDSLQRRAAYTPRSRAKRNARSGESLSPQARNHKNRRQDSSTDASTIFIEAPTYWSDGSDVASVAVADVNGDGKLDLLAINECNSLPDCSNGVVAVFLGNGDGTFQTAQAYDSGGSAASVAVYDVNGDGKLDMVVANSYSDTVGVLLGNGDGTFQNVQTYASGGDGALSIAVGDVNGDGKPDVLVGNACISDSDCTNGVVAVLLGDGNGTFQTAQTYNSGGYIGYSGISLALADVNGDGKLDVLVANACASGSNGCSVDTGTAGVLLGNGDGTFQAAKTYGSGGNNASSIAVADVNGDGKPDLLVANDCGSSCNNDTATVGVLLGNGDGTFQAAVDYNSEGPFAFSIAVADVNGDGKPDLVVSSRSVIVLLGNGDGSFQAPLTFGEGGYNALSIAVGDINGDGKLDLVTANDCPGGPCGQDSEVAVLLGKGDGTFRAAPIYNSGGFASGSTAVGDVNGDGTLDLIVANPCADNSCATSSIGVLLGTGKGSFRAVMTYNLGSYSLSSIAVADVNGDGKLDVLVAGGTSAGSVGVLLGNGDGTFQALQSYSSGGFGADSIAAADVNGDGKPDLLVANYCASLADCNSDNEPGSVGALLGNGDGTFQPVLTYNSGSFYASSIAVADVNGDGKPDLLVANCGGGCYSFSTGGVASVLLGNGDGTFQPAQNYDSGGLLGRSIAVGDVNGDGKPDLIAINEYADGTTYNGGVGILLGNGDGTFQTAQTVTIFGGALYSGQIALADFNGDGKLDIASGEIGALLIGNGDGTFQSPLSLGAIGEGTAMGDFTGSGRPSIAVANNDYTPGLTILLAAAAGTKATSTTTLTSSVNPSLLGKPVTFTATVSSSAGTPTGTVQFLNGTAVFATVMLTSGTAQYTTRQLPIGSNAITAAYSGDSNNAASTSVPLNQMVLVPTSTIFTAAPNPASYGQEILLTATVTSSMGAPPNGEAVTFKQGTNILGTGTLINGVATLTTPATGIGSVSGTAIYMGDTTFQGSVSEVLYEFISRASSSTTLTSSQNPSSYGQPVTFTATVAPQFGGMPTGVVVFSNGTRAVRVALVGGVATYTTSKLTIGTDTITATYDGSADFTGSAASLLQTVQ